ncbi:hypothetical protein [Emticicia sp. BO119]|uniref:hypothetical protein n=1 Tax=Emticicia sp. BO119 TaxID=2757768 RepID=UPI0015F0F808|nr:hypothetical protein [Emticicia sp. BO119]MBA4852480.1 hypothetical protein [Emticicia sp. BO119]
MKKLLSLALISLLFACKEDRPAPENLIVGKWKLISYCKRNGTNACTNITMPDNKCVYVEFSKKGSFEETYKGTIPVEYAFLGCGGGGYIMENDDIRIQASCMSSSNGALITVKLLTERQLVLIPFETGDYVFERELILNT